MRVKTAKDLGNLVHDRRKALGMTQAQLAAQVGVSRLWVNQVESGHGGASLGKVLQLLSVLELVMNLADAHTPSDGVVAHSTERSTQVRSATSGTFRQGRARESSRAAMKVAMPRARAVVKKDR